VIATGAGRRGGTVLSRVRDLLGDVRDSTRFPGDGFARERLAEAMRSGEAQRDLGEVQRRIRRLKSLHPELSVETGPLLFLAAESLERMEPGPAMVRRAPDAGIRGAAR
jgi:hypothetical protein